MKLNSLLFYFFLCFLFCLTRSSAQIILSEQDSLVQYKNFLESRDQYYAFERQHGHFIQTPNVNMHYLTWGKPGGIPLVWTHGTNGNSYELFDIADSLVQMGFYVIAIDFYGHGLTPIPAKEVSLYHVADDIDFLMKHLKIKKAVMGGWSRGGSISTAFYDAYPEKVMALILEDGGSVAWDVNGHKVSVDSLTRQFERQFKDQQAPRRFANEFQVYKRIYKFHGTKPTFRKTLFLFYSALKLESANVFVYNPGLKDLVSEASAEQLLAAIHRPLAANSMFGASTHLLYPKIIYRNLAVPMLIFDPVSKDDVFDFEKENALLQKQHPTLITHKVYQNTGHTVKEERTVEFLNDIRQFLKALPRK